MNNQKDILKDRIEAKKKGLEAKLAELKADTRKNASDEIEELRTAIDDLGEAIRRGWDNMTEKAAARVNQILES